MSTTKLYRQGDVLLERVEISEEGPDELEIVGADIVLARGEATGHAHRICRTPGVPVRAWGDWYGSIVVEVGHQGARVEHEEHDAIFLPEGRYIVRQQREYVPKNGSGGSSRFVRD